MSIKQYLFTTIFLAILTSLKNCIEINHPESAILKDIEVNDGEQEKNNNEQQQQEMEKVEINFEDDDALEEVNSPVLQESDQQEQEQEQDQVQEQQQQSQQINQKESKQQKLLQQAVQQQQQGSAKNQTNIIEPGKPVQFTIKNQGKKYRDFLFPINSTDNFNILLQTAEKQEVSTIQVQLHSHFNETLFKQYEQVKWTTHGEEKSLENERAHSININTQQVECGPGCVFSIRCFGIGSLNLTAYYQEVFMQTNQSFIQNLEMGQSMVYHILDSQEFFMYVEFFSPQSNIQLKIFRDNVTQIMNQKLSTPFEYYIKPGTSLVQSSSKHYYDIKVTALQESEILIGTIDRNQYFNLFQQEQSEIDHWEEEEFAIIIFAIILLFLAFCINKYMSDFNTSKKQKKYQKLKNNLGTTSNNYLDSESEQISLI